MSASVIAAIALSILAAPAFADDAPDLTVTGILARTADVEGTFIIAGNSAVPIEPDAVAGFAPGTTIEASLAIPAITARSLRVTSDVDAESATGEAVVGAVTEPFEVTEVAAVETAAATTATAHYVDIAVNDNADVPTQPTNAQIKAAVATASGYWKANTGGAFPGFTVRTIVRYDSSLECGEHGDDDWAEEAAYEVGHSLNYYFSSSRSNHLLMIGECRFDSKVAVGTVGSSLASGGFVVVQADLFAEDYGVDFLDGTLAHEFGHNFGMEHANQAKTAGCDFSAVPAYTDIDVCDTEAYGDRWSIMGYAVPLWWAPILDIARRDQLGVASSSMLAKQSGSRTVSYTLNPLGSSTGLRGVKISAPSGATYYVEYRDGTGEPGALYLDKDKGCTTGWQPSTTCAFSKDMVGAGPGVRVLTVDEDGATRVESVNTQKQEPRWAERALDAGDWWRSPTGDVTIAITAAASGKATIIVTTGVIPAVDVSGLRLDHEAGVGSPVTASVASPTPSGATLTYRWFRGGLEIGGATSATYTPPAGSANTQLTVRVEGKAPGYAPSQAVLTVPIYAGVPSISGTPRANVSLAAVKPSQVPEGASLAYQWLLNGADVVGATGGTFIPQPADVGATVAVRVTAAWTDVAGPHSLTLTSAPVGPVALATNRSLATLPLVSGVATVGESLTLDPGNTLPASSGVTVQWLRDGLPIPGATGATYALTQADYGATVRASVIFSLAGYVPLTAASAGALVDGGAANTEAPAVSGDVRVGSTVSATGAWATNFALSYQWLREGNPIPGATERTYVPTASDLGKQLSVSVTGTHPSLGAAGPLTSDAVVVAAGMLTAPTPTITGTALVGKKLTAVRGTWTAGATIRYQWYASGAAISGATSSTYTVASSRAGKLISVKVFGSKAGYGDTAKVSAAKGVPIVGKVTITGKPKVGSKLTAHRGTWTAGTTFTYQWYAAGVKISGATKSTYTVTSGKVGKYLTVHVTGKKKGFTTAVGYSARTAKAVR